MKDRPILFNAPMVRAALDGSKTQTRRVVKLTDAAHVKEPRGHRRWHPGDPDATQACPYGQPGDRLWVRETWLKTNPWSAGGHHTYGYRASDAIEFPDAVWRPSIHMPRIASRITLEITGVRVERLQDISEADAKAEGVKIKEKFVTAKTPSHAEHRAFLAGVQHLFSKSLQSTLAYACLWQSINGPTSWAANPWVWVVEFKALQK